MDSLNFSLFLLLISPAVILALHIIISRTAKYFKWQISPQKLTLVCIVLGNFPLGLLEWFLVLQQLDLAGQFWGAVYCILTYNAIGHVYFHLFNMTETSIRVRLLREIDAQGQTIDEVIDRYNPSNSVGVRLQRLQDIGMVKQAGDRYFLQSQWLYYVGIVCRAWGVLLGFSEKDNGYITSAKEKSRHLNYSISMAKRNIAVRSNFGIAVIILLFIVSITHLLPTIMGLSFWPLPYGLYTDNGPMGDLNMPANLTAVDNFSFPHVDWPWRKMTRHFLELGELPLWNPYASLGLPFAPQYQNQFFLPLEWIEIFGNPYLWNILLVAKLLFAGIGSMLLVRRFCSTAPSILIGGLFYAYSGYFLWLNTIPGFINGVMIIPWLFLSVVYLFDERMHVVRRVGQFALAFGFLWLSGQPQISALSSLSASILFGWCWFQARTQTPIKVPLLGLMGVGLGLLIAAPQLWLFFEALGQTYSIHSPGSYGLGGTNFLNFTISIWPFLFGQIMSPWDGHLFPAQINWEGFPLVMGTSGLLLSIHGLTAFMLPDQKAKRPFLLFPIITILVFSFLIIISGRFEYSLWNVPGLDRINFPRYIVPVLSLCVACLCAWGAENLRSSSLRWLIIPPVFLFIFGVITAGVTWPIFKNALSSALVDSAYFRGSLALGILPSVLVMITWVTVVLVSAGRKTEQMGLAWSTAVVAAGELIFFVRLGFGINDELLRLMILAIVCFAAIAMMWRRIFIAAALMVIAVISFISILVQADYRLAPVEDPYAIPPKHIVFLQSVAGVEEGNPRILSSQGIMIPNVGNAFGLSELTSLNPLQVDRTAKIIFNLLSMKELDYTTPNAWPGITPDAAYPSWDDYFAHRSIYNAFAVEYLVDSPTGPLSKITDPTIKPVYSDSNVTIYRDLLAMPRAYMINSVRPVKDFDKALSLLGDSKVDPRSQAVIEAFPYELPSGITKRSIGQVNRLTITHFGSTRIEIILNSPDEGLAVLADAYYPGWKAEIDGKPRKIFIVNGVLRGVVIEPDDKILTFYYSPRGFPFLLIASVLSFLTCLSGIILPILLRKLQNVQNRKGSIPVDTI